MTDQLLDSDTLPLVLLAALGHPDCALRERLRQRLDTAIEEGQPLHSEARMREFLTTQAGTPLEPFYLDPVALEAGVRVGRLLFARRTRKLSKRTLRIVSCEVLDEGGGLVLNHNLKTLYLERFIYGKKKRGTYRRPVAERPDFQGLLVHKAGRRFKEMLQHSTVLVSGGASPRLRQFYDSNKLVEVECRAEDGFQLSFRGELPWAHRDLTENPYSSLRTYGPRVRLNDGSTLGKHRGLSSLGLTLEPRPGELRLRTTTPESVIRFSACLNQQERLVLRDSNPKTPGRIVVLLRDFDGDWTRLPAVVSYAGAETWLRGAPAVPLTVDDDERLAITRWAYPPEAWLTNELLEKLF